MYKFMLKKLKKDNRGFTLVELIVVVAILGILAAIAVPRLNISKKKAAIAAHNANVKTLMNAANLYYVENGVSDGQSITWDKDKKDDENGWGKYLQEWPEIPDGLTKEDFKDLKDDDDLKYTVTIEENGTITVTPGLIDEDANESTQNN